MIFSLITANFLTGLDQLLHGNNLQGWGQPNRVDPTLLYVRGFDPSTQSFLYDVNGRFGSTNASQYALVHTPGLVALQARMVLGPDPRERFRATFSSRIGSLTGSGGAGTEVANPIAQIIALRDSLQLSQDQVDRLTVISDTLAAKTKIIGDSIRAQVAKQGNANPQSIFASIRPQIMQGRKNLTAALAQAQAILTQEQWAKVPASIKTPPAFGRQGGGQGRNRD